MRSVRGAVVVFFAAEAAGILAWNTAATATTSARRTLYAVGSSWAFAVALFDGITLVSAAWHHGRPAPQRLGLPPIPTRPASRATARTRPGAWQPARIEAVGDNDIQPRMDGLPHSEPLPAAVSPARPLDAWGSVTRYTEWTRPDDAPPHPEDRIPVTPATRPATDPGDTLWQVPAYPADEPFPPRTSSDPRHAAQGAW